MICLLFAQSTHELDRLQVFYSARGAGCSRHCDIQRSISATMAASGSSATVNDSQDSESLAHFLEESENLILEASEAHPHCFDTCTYDLGPIRQSVYWCKTYADIVSYVMPLFINLRAIIDVVILPGYAGHVVFRVTEVRCLS